MSEQSKRINALVNIIWELPDWQGKLKSRKLLRHLADFGGGDIESRWKRTSLAINDALSDYLEKNPKRSIPMDERKAIDADVRQTAQRLKDDLVELYLDRVWRDQPDRLSVSRERDPMVGHFVTTLILAPSTERTPTAFWYPHLTKGQRSEIVICEPLFFRSRDDTFYLRDFRTNNPTDKDKVQAAFKLSQQIVPSSHYVSIGEVRGMIQARDFIIEKSRKNVIPGFTTSRVQSWKELRGLNLVILGPARSNWLIRDTQRNLHLRSRTGLPFIAAKTLIARRETGKRTRVTDDPGSNTHVGNAHVLITRGPLFGGALAFTAISSNHGVAVEAVCKYLTSDAITDLIAKAETAAGTWNGFPPAFQALLSTSLLPSEEGAENVKCIEFRVIDLKVEASTV